MSKPHSHRHIEKDRLKTSRTAQQTVPQHTGNLIANSTAKSKRMVSEVEPLPAILIAAVCIAVLAVHWPALSAKAFSFDDNVYLIDNMLVQNPSWYSAKRFLTEVLEPSTVGGYYQPLAMISLMLDYALGGGEKNLMPFHRTSLIFHIANTALIIVLLYLLFGQIWVAAGVGLLFGIHPMTVEPIPWVGERKTLLAAFFSLWSLILYVYPRVTSHKSRVTKFYIGSFVMYLLALMSKPTSTPLPAVMLLMDFWPLRRMSWRAFLEKLPLFVVGGASAVITYLSQSLTASVIMPESYGLMRVPQVICHNIIFYLYKMIWPANLSSHYAFPDPLGFLTPMVMIGVIGTFILIPLLLLSLRWTRAALTGWLIFFVMVFPTMQMLQFSDVIASDKFVYLPSIGILMIVAAFLGWICADGVYRHEARYATVAIIVLLLAGAESFGTRHYLACWKDTASLFAQMTRVTPNAISPRNNLGVALAERGDVNQAMELFNEVLKMKPGNTEAHLNLGKLLADQGKYDEAMRHYKEVLRLLPNDAAAYQHVAVMLVNDGRLEEAIEVLRKGLEYKPRNSAMLHIGLGTIYMQQGKVDQAIPEFQIAVRQRPDSTTFNNLGVALSLKGKIDEAIKCHKKAIQLDPRNAEAYYNLGNIFYSQDNFKKAIGEYEKAVSINPKYTKAHINLGVSLMEEGWLDQAARHLAEALKIEPNNVMAHYNMAAVMTEGDWLEEAVKEYRQVLQLQPQDANVHCALGDVLVKQARYEEAAAEYNEALRINPQNSQAQEGLKKISSMQHSEQPAK